MIQWGHDHSPEPPVNPVTYWEDGWLDECFSTFAEYYFIEDFAKAGDSYYSKSGPGDYSLIYFESYDPSRLIFSYLYEHYGGDSLLKTLIADQNNGISSINSSLATLGYSIPFEELFTNWVIACRVDDTLFNNGLYGFRHYDFFSLPALFLQFRNHSSYPLNNIKGDVRPYSAKYVNFNYNTSYPNIKINFDGIDTSSFRLACMFFNYNVLVNVMKIGLDSLNNGSIIAADSFGKSYNKVVMAIINTKESTDPIERASFSYSVSEYNSVKPTDAARSITVFPNPAGSELHINYSEPQSEDISITITDLTGKVVKEYHRQGSQYDHISLMGISPGMYFIFFSSELIKEAYKILVR
jgi:hypothetical protein